MQKISFTNDFITGAHPAILKRLLKTNSEVLSAYGLDPYSESAREKIRKACEAPDADVFFLLGGTETNAVVISTMLNDYEGVIAAKTGHISTHEAGAIEFTGHKILEVKAENGKILPSYLGKYLEDFFLDKNYEHMAIPGMVYISYPTEYGTLYTKNELSAIAKIAHTYHLPLYADGARLGYGLMSHESDLTLPEFANLCDVFYIGGTKVGALCGEAVVFKKGLMPQHFITSVKRRGALLAKGRLLGVQFDTLFTDNLYFVISRHAIDMAEKLKDILKESGIPFFIESPTNQQFVILENAQAKNLSNYLGFSFWEKYDTNHIVARFATSWSTKEEDLLKLKEVLNLVK